MKSNDDQTASGKVWPPRDVVRKLADFADDRLTRKDFDGHGWEELRECVIEARAFLDLPSSEPTPECCIDDVAHANPEPSDGRALFIRCDKHKRREKLADDYYPEPTTEPAETFEGWWIRDIVTEPFTPEFKAAKEIAKQAFDAGYEAGRRSR